MLVWSDFIVETLNSDRIVVGVDPIDCNRRLLKVEFRSDVQIWMSKVMVENFSVQEELVVVLKFSFDIGIVKQWIVQSNPMLLFVEIVDEICGKQ